MKAKDLIRVLSQHDGDMEVSVSVEEWGCGACQNLHRGRKMHEHSR